MVTPAADDWSLSNVVWIFTVAIVCLGLAAAFAGKWLEEVGPRTVGVVAALCWGGGFLIGGLGIALHQLWLIYLGYGVIGGCGTNDINRRLAASSSAGSAALAQAVVG